MRRFYDFECDRILTEEQLREEYEEFKHDIEISSGATTFEESLVNATGKNGYLDDLSDPEKLERLMHRLARKLVEYDRHEYPSEWAVIADMWNTIYGVNTALGNDVLARYRLL